MKNWYYFSQNQILTTCTKSSYLLKRLVSNHHIWKICIKTHPCQELVPNPDTCETHWHQFTRFITDVKNWYLIVTDVSDKTMKNWDRMLNAADFFRGGGGILSMWGIRIYALWNWLRAYFSQSVRYWYETCDVLVHVPIFHVLWGIGTNSSQCEIYEVWK